MQAKKAGFISTAVCEFYDNLRKASSKDLTFIAATRIADRTFKDLETGRLEEENVLHIFCAAGGGRRCTALEIREELFQWFVVRTGLKGRLPKKLFLLKAQELYEGWLKVHPGTPESKKLQFGKQWVRKPNKRFFISKEDCIIRVKDYICNVRRFFLKKYGVDPPVINGDQMLLHRNESSS